MWTVKPADKFGRLEIFEDGELVGVGRTKASKTEPGYVSLTLFKKGRQTKEGKFTKIEPEETVLLRVPINWLEEMGKLDE